MPGCGRLGVSIGNVELIEPAGITAAAMWAGTPSRPNGNPFADCSLETRARGAGLDANGTGAERFRLLSSAVASVLARDAGDEAPEGGRAETD